MQSLVNSMYRVLQSGRRSRKAPNERIEAYTGNYAGRREDRFLLKQFSLVMHSMQAAMVWVSQKPAQGGRKRRGLRGPVGIIKRGMYRELDCELGRPLAFPSIAGRRRLANVSPSKCTKGVRSPHSTLRRESRSHGEGGDSVA
jgi:hypothetical protein